MLFETNSLFVPLQMCPSQRWGDKEPLFLEGEFSGAVEEHKSRPALDYSWPSPQLGLPSWSRGPHAGRGHWTQIPTLKDSYTEDMILPLTLHPPGLHLPASVATAHRLFLLQRTGFFWSLTVIHVWKPFYWDVFLVSLVVMVTQHVNWVYVRVTYL